MKYEQSPNAFSIPVRVYYEDTDAGGVVYYANYLKFFERCRSEWMRRIGHDQSQLAADAGIAFVARKASCEYLKPAREAAKQICLQRYREFGCAGQGSKIRATPLSVIVEKYRRGELAQAVV